MLRAGVAIGSGYLVGPMLVEAVAKAKYPSTKTVIAGITEQAIAVAAAHERYDLVAGAVIAALVYYFAPSSIR